MDYKTLDDLCELSKFSFTDAEKQEYLERLSETLGILDAVKSDEIKHLVYDDTCDYESINYGDLRDDIAEPSLEHEVLFQNTVCRDNYYVVPKVVE